MSDIDTLFRNLVSTVKELRAPGGCPWDRRQTTDSLVKYLQSEFTELLEAIEKKDNANICEELGDMLFLIVMISQINSESEIFTIDDVISGIDRKLVRRHPHVFAGVEISSEEELRAQWERIKAAEKAQKLI